MVVDHEPPLEPPPPKPQAPAAMEIMPLLSVWRHLTPKPPKGANVIELEAYKLVVLALVLVALVVIKPPKNWERPVVCKVEEANKPPELFTNKRDEPKLFLISKRLAVWIGALRIKNGTAEDEVASTVSTALPGEVVPMVD